VAYDNGTGQCREGTPPYGLTNSFLTGGYALWGQWMPELRALGLALVSLAESREANDISFMLMHYRSLTNEVSSSIGMVNNMMFWPSLVYVK
jgi:hypothetical protein